MARKHLIIGTGSAALSALESLRTINTEDEVKLVTREDLMPYSPTALPFLLSERIKEEDLWLREGSFFEKMQSTLEMGKEVVRVLPEEKRVRYRDGSEESYDTLLIAAGSHPVVRSITGLQETGYNTFHTFYDYRAIRKELESKGLEEKGKVVIYGGGLVATELAIPLLEAGYCVELVIRSRILRSYVTEAIGERVEEILVDRGAKIHSGCTVQEVKKNSNGVEVRLSNGRVLHSHIQMVLALGVEPSISFLEGSGIRTNEGVIVDTRMRTNVDGIYAAGDVAEAPEFFYNKRGLSGILPSAVRQGKVAGLNMGGTGGTGGGEEQYPGWIPMNMFNFFGHVVFSIGLSGAADVHVTELVDSNRGHRKLCFQGGRLVGACFFDVRVDPGVFLYLIENKMEVGAYEDLLLEKPLETGRWLMLEAERNQSKM